MSSSRQMGVAILANNQSSFHSTASLPFRIKGCLSRKTHLKDYPLVLYQDKNKVKLKNSNKR